MQRLTNENCFWFWNCLSNKIIHLFALKMKANKWKLWKSVWVLLKLRNCLTAFIVTEWIKLMNGKNMAKIEFVSHVSETRVESIDVLCAHIQKTSFRF